MFATEVDRFIPAHHPYRTLRVPLDVVHVVCTGAIWVPRSSGEYNISETVRPLQAALWQPAHVAHPPDWDIYYSLQWAAYWRPFADLAMRTLMRPQPLLFGI